MTKAVGPRLIIQPDKAEEVTASGIVVATKEQLNRQQKATTSGKVIDMGSVAFKEIGDGTPWCSIGDKVDFVKYAGAEFKDSVTGETLLYLSDEDVLGVH